MPEQLDNALCKEDIGSASMARNAINGKKLSSAECFHSPRMPAVADNMQVSLRSNRSIIVVAELAKSFGARRNRKSRRLPLPANRTVIDRTVLGSGCPPLDNIQ